MYNHIAGTLDSKTPNSVVVDAGGVGYLLRVPFSTASALPSAGQRVKLLAYLHVTDDALALFGFATEEEREFFIQLMTVNGVGPKLALAVLSGGRVQDIKQAIRLGDYATLKRIKGVGESTAKKIVLELGKILIHQAETAASPAAGRRNRAAPWSRRDWTRKRTWQSRPSCSCRKCRRTWRCRPCSGRSRNCPRQAASGRSCRM